MGYCVLIKEHSSTDHTVDHLGVLYGTVPHAVTVALNKALQDS